VDTQQATSATPFVPAGMDLDGLRLASQACRGCDLYKRATRTVFGEGPANATAIFVGEQPGDQEDLAGRPFVGPAGRMLDKALQQAGIDRSLAYVTNAVKHFKWEPRGKRRIHATPRESEIQACRPWLEAEVEDLDPALIVAMGSTAVSSVFGKDVRVLRDRGQIIETAFGRPGLVTVHPSSLLRAPDDAARRAAYDAFLRDLDVAADFLRRH
jgi:uracil-DNA glycosylase family protein